MHKNKLTKPKENDWSPSPIFCSIRIAIIDANIRILKKFLIRSDISKWWFCDFVFLALHLKFANLFSQDISKI